MISETLIYYMAILVKYLTICKPICDKLVGAHLFSMALLLRKTATITF